MDRYREAAKTWAALEEMKDEQMAEARAKFKEEHPDYKRTEVQDAVKHREVVARKDFLEAHLGWMQIADIDISGTTIVESLDTLHRQCLRTHAGIRPIVQILECTGTVAQVKLCLGTYEQSLIG